jgi:protein-disulfide isomerase
MHRPQLLTLLALVVLAALTSYLLRTSRSLGRDVGASPVAAQVLNDRTSPQEVHGNASLTVVMFTDYQCPGCRTADPALQAAVARDGNVRVVYRDWPIFGERSERAAKVALAAHRQGIYPVLHHRLMRSPSFEDGPLRMAVEESGGNWRQLQGDLVKDEKPIANQLVANSTDAFALGLRGTPGYLIGPLLVQGALTEREFLRVFAQARSET